MASTSPKQNFEIGNGKGNFEISVPIVCNFWLCSTYSAFTRHGFWIIKNACQTIEFFTTSQKTRSITIIL